jgi:uncharacterized membrane protein
VSTPSLESFWWNARRELAFRDESGGFSLILKRNCSIAPRGLACVFAALAVAVLGIGIGFAIAGAWLILPFAGLEVLLLGGAFVLQARHAADYERIELSGGKLRVEVGEAERIARYELDARQARVDMQGPHVLLRGAGEELRIGRHLDDEARVAFAAELKNRLRI